MTNRVKTLKLTDFRGFSGEHDPVQTDADIVLVTGKNGSGKTSFLSAITLLLNGYDSNLFKSIDLVNVHSSSKTCLIGIEGISSTVFPESAMKSADWKEWKTPFEISRTELKPAIARVATAYFQDKAEEIATGEFLTYLTGAANQGGEIRSWLNNTASLWKERSDKSLPSEKNWDEARKQIFNKWIQIGNDGLKSILQESYDSFNPVQMRNGNLSKHWQSQIYNFGKSIGIEQSEYGSNQLAMLIEALRKKEDQLQTDQRDKSQSPENNAEQSLTKLLVAIETSTIDILPPSTWDKIAAEVQREKETLAKLRQELDELRNCEPKSSSLDQVIGVLSDNIDDGMKEADRLKACQLPLPEDVHNFISTVHHSNVQEIGESLNKWRNLLSRAILEKTAIIKEHAEKLKYKETSLAVSNHISNINKTEELLKEAAYSAEPAKIIEMISNLTAAAAEPEKKSSLNLLNDLIKEIQKLLDLEEEYEIATQQKMKMDSFIQAKDYAQTWYDAFSKESRVSGIFQKTVNDLDLSSVTKELRLLLDGFHLPSEFVSNIELNRRGSGKNAAIVPELNNVNFNNLSTGQKTLFALSWTIVLNASLRRKLGHGVMLFDDITTSLDLNQIIPACVLFRKMAYSSDTTKRRQIFISSHHEDLTNRLIDNLIPPEGFAMRVLEFNDFSVQKGPVIDEWDVAPAKHA
ncbi:MAG: hypothetical protein EOM12_05300 [Verrucomicrobiae bacterium]|nr:hypothetical protein [Verrucomicrobiae bacterium]